MDIVKPFTVTIFFIRLKNAADACPKIVGEASTLGYSSSTASEFAFLVSTRLLNLCMLAKGSTWVSNLCRCCVSPCKSSKSADLTLSSVTRLRCSVLRNKRRSSSLAILSFKTAIGFVKCVIILVKPLAFQLAPRCERVNTHGRVFPLREVLTEKLRRAMQL